MHCSFWTDVVWVSLTFSDNIQSHHSSKAFQSDYRGKLFLCPVSRCQSNWSVKRKKRRDEGKETCAASRLWSPSSHPRKSSEGHEPEVMTHGSCTCNPAHAEKLGWKNNNKGRVMPLLSASTTFCHSLSLCCLLKQTLDKAFSLESGLKEQGIRQHFYSGWACGIISPSDRTGAETSNKKG